MGKRLNILLIAVVLAGLSFGYARYRYLDKNSATLTNPFNKNERTTIANPLRDEKLFGDWVKKEMVFAIILPVVFLAGGVVWAAKK